MHVETNLQRVRTRPKADGAYTLGLLAQKKLKSKAVRISLLPCEAAKHGTAVLVALLIMNLSCIGEVLAPL